MIGRSRQRGFSLVEMAVVLVIAGLLLGGIINSIAAFQRNLQIDETRRQLTEARDALVAFAVINGRLPCPATGTLANTAPGAGLERAPTPLGCSGGQSGVLPWATLGLRETEGFGRRITYRVAAAFSGSGSAFLLTTPGDVTVRNRSGVLLADTVPAILVSHGANARGSFGPSGAAAPASTDPAEAANQDGDALFVSDDLTDAYDDLVAWVPRPLLMHRMLQAGRLP